MGMYTHVRGWIRLNNKIWNIEEERDRIVFILERAKDISPRSEQCVTSTVWNMGSNMESYLFIGGEIKNYDNDWNKFIQFLKDNLDINEMKLEMKYEEDEVWTLVE